MKKMVVTSGLLAVALVGLAGSAKAETATYTYDVHGRLTAVHASGVQDRTTTYAYDSADNRTAVFSSVHGFRFYAVPTSGGTLIILP